MEVYTYIEHLFLETGFPINASLIITVAIIIYLCRKEL